MTTSGGMPLHMVNEDIDKERFYGEESNLKSTGQGRPINEG
jgi:hypothetical protein